MSQENVERVERSLDSFNQGDLDAALRDLHPEVEWHDQRELPGGRPFTTAGKPPQSTFAPRSELSPDTAWTRRSSCT